MTKSPLPTTEERKRLRYEEAVKHHPPGACYCDYDDRECYRRGHWNAMPSKGSPMLRQVKDRELIDLTAARTVGGPHHAPLMIHPVVCITTEMRDRLVATIRHLRRVVRRQRDAARPHIILGDTHYGELETRKRT